MSKKTSYLEPQVWLSPMFDEYGEAVVTKRLPSKQQLADIDISFLKHVIKRWQKNNRRLKKEGENTFNSKEPTLILPLNPKGVYEGDVVLCRIMNEGKISLIDKWLIKQAFIFRNPQSDEDASTPSIESNIRILNESVIKAIRSLSKDQFDSAYKEYKNFHLLLLELGEIEAEGKKLNYAIMEGKWFSGRLHNDWTRSYRSIFEEVVTVLPQQDDFYRTCCYTSYYLIDSILAMPSMTGFDSVLAMQGYLWFRLNEWWREQVEKQGSQEHDNAASAELLPPEAKTYTQAVKAFIEGWEATQRVIISKADKHTNGWEDYSLVFKAFECHLKGILNFVARGVLTGNRHAARETAEMLVRWQGNISLSLHEDSNDYWLAHGIKAVNTSAELIEQPWVEVELLLEESDEFKLKHSQKTVLKAVLNNYWQDTSTLLSAFLINWSLAASIENSLSKEILYKLLKGVLEDDANNHGKTAFASNLQDYLIIFLRQHIRHHWQKESYSSKLSGVCGNIDNLTEPDRVCGRVYSGVGDSIDSLRAPLIVLGIMLCKKNEPDVLTQKTKESISLLLKDEDIASHLEYVVKQFIEAADSLDLEAIARVFGDYIAPEELRVVVPNVTSSNADSDIVAEEAPETETPIVHYGKRREVVKQLFVGLQQLVHSYRADRVRALPISDSRLLEIVENASSKAFDKSTAKFPVSFFDEVEFTTTPLKERKLINSNFPKGVITEPLMDKVHFSEDWHSETVAPYVYAYLVFDIFDAAKTKALIEEVGVTTQQEYVDAVTAKAAELRALGLTPIIVTENFHTPKWIRDWESAKWDRRIQLPQNLLIERKEQRDRGGYLFHLNDIPVYEGKALIGGTLIVALEMLKKVRFRQFDNGYPVNVSFEPKTDDPWYGTLSYEWQREAVIGDEKVFLIKYPSVEEQEI
jgi:hypothetical protein